MTYYTLYLYIVLAFYIVGNNGAIMTGSSKIPPGEFMKSSSISIAFPESVPITATEYTNDSFTLTATTTRSLRTLHTPLSLKIPPSDTNRFPVRTSTTTTKTTFSSSTIRIVNPFSYRTSSRSVKTLPTSKSQFPIQLLTTTTAITTTTTVQKSQNTQQIATTKNTTTTIKKTTTTTTQQQPTTQSPQQTVNCVQEWGQCGGIGYNGPTCCVSGYVCHKYGDYYFQCIPK